jgi:hypothetical protein
VTILELPTAPRKRSLNFMRPIWAKKDIIDSVLATGHLNLGLPKLRLGLKKDYDLE